MPGAHPDAPRRRSWLRRRVGRLFRHYRFLRKEQAKLAEQHERDVDLFFDSLAGHGLLLSDTVQRLDGMERLVAEARERPEALAVAELTESFRQLIAVTERHHDENDERVMAFASMLGDFADQMAGIAAASYQFRTQLLDLD